MLVLTEPMPQKPLRVGLGAEGLGQRGDLDRVADRRAGAVGLDVGDRLGGDAGEGQRLGDGAGLAVDARRQVAGLARAVVVDGRALDHGVDVVAVGEGVLQAAQHDDPRAAAEDGALRAGVEGAAVAVGGEDLALLVEVALAVRHLDGHAAGEGHVALAVEQALAGQVDGDQRGGAGGLHVDAGPVQVEQVRDAGGQEVLVVPGVPDQEHPDLADQGRVGEQVVHQVGVHPRAAEDADGAGEASGRVAGVLQGLPGALQEVAVLRVHDRRVARAEAEEAGVEELHVRQDGPGLDVVGHGAGWPRPRRRRAARRRVKRGHRLHAVAQVAPELGRCLRAPGKRPAMPTTAMSVPAGSATVPLDHLRSSLCPLCFEWLRLGAQTAPAEQHLPPGLGPLHRLAQLTGHGLRLAPPPVYPLASPGAR